MRRLRPSTLSPSLIPSRVKPVTGSQGSPARERAWGSRIEAVLLPMIFPVHRTVSLAVPTSPHSAGPEQWAKEPASKVGEGASLNVPE